MKNITKIAVVVLLTVIVVGAMILKQGPKNFAHPETVALDDEPPPLENDDHALPRLLDLGAGKCIPCKMMAPILEELKEEYKGRFEVVFIDVWENPDEAGQHGIKLIPTQLFFDEEGKELFRHEGFFSKEDILATWKELGVDITSSHEH